MELFIALMPAFIMIGLVIITRKVLLSLSIGVVVAALIHESFQITTLNYLWNSFYSIITSLDWYLPIIAFVVLIGGLTSITSFSGGVKAFADWAVTKVKTPIASQLMTWFLGVIICIDDYFNLLVIGEISKPITDRYHVSRAKLAYIIDSTSAPVVIMMPLSTWGAYIVGIIGSVFSEVGYQGHSGFSGLVAAIPYQFYPLSALALIFLMIIFKINIGPMKTFEEGAMNGNDTSKLMDATVDEVQESKALSATHWNLILPVVLLIGVTLFLMAYNANFEGADFLNQDITIPLFFGGLLAFVLAFFMALWDKNIEFIKLSIVASKGLFSMAKSAVAILVLAWMVSGAIQDLGVGNLVAAYIVDTNISASFMPVILFVIAAFIAFSTGTSWGAFGILLPIAIPVAMVTNVGFMPVFIAAVLGGAVVGDHASPVSDTTVLSATGAQSHLHAHFISQLPYVLISACIAGIAFVVYGVTQILVLAYLSMIVLLGGFVLMMKQFFK